MKLLLSMLSWPNGAKAEMRGIATEMTLGRGRESGWALLDPDNVLSRKHCVFTPYGDGWRVTDLSLNGTFVNESEAPLGQQRSHELHDGDRVRIGAYVIEARYEAPPSLNSSPMSDMTSGLASLNDDHTPFAAPARASGTWHDENRWQEPAATPLPGTVIRAEGFVGQPVDDHLPGINQAWHAPVPGGVFIPEDWDSGDASEMPQPAAWGTPVRPASPPETSGRSASATSSASISCPIRTPSISTAATTAGT